MNRHTQIHITLNNVLNGARVCEEDLQELAHHIHSMENMLDETDMDDYFGTEGWKHRLGLDE